MICTMNYLMMKMKMMNKYIFLFAFVLSGCYTAQKAERKLAKAYDKQPKVVAEFTRAKFPCILVNDTIMRIDTMYDFVEVVCPDQPIANDTIYLTNDRIKYVQRYLPGKIQYVKTPVITKERLKIVKDSAEIYILTAQATKCAIDKQKAENKAERRLKWILWLLIALIGSVIVNIIKFRKL